MAYTHEYGSWDDERTAVEKRRLRREARRTAHERNGIGDIRYAAKALVISAVVLWGTYMAGSALGGALYGLRHPHPGLVAEAGR